MIYIRRAGTDQPGLHAIRLPNQKRLKNNFYSWTKTTCNIVINSISVSTAKCDLLTVKSEFSTAKSVLSTAKMQFSSLNLDLGPKRLDVYCLPFLNFPFSKYPNIYYLVCMPWAYRCDGFSATLTDKIDLVGAAYLHKMQARQIQAVVLWA